MSKSELSYTVISELDRFINKEIGKRMMASGGTKILKKDIIAEIAEYCGLTWDGMNRIKRGLALPSLPVAFKIAQYFNVRIEEIFKLDE